MPQSSIKTVLRPKEKDIGDFAVRRALPFAQQRSIGPWVFFDHFGPVTFKPGEGINVRPHPHINLATVTYLFEGEIFHRDTLGNALPIHPGAINLMVAGRGIAHSERTRPELRETGYNLHGLQLWMALPEEYEEVEPAFYHHPTGSIPDIDIGGVNVRVMMGTAYGLTSPVETFSPTLYLEADMPDGSELSAPDCEEMGIYVVQGEAEIDGDIAPINCLSVLGEKAVTIKSKGRTRFALIGGKPLGKRHLWWNFVSSKKDRIEQAKQDWKDGKFGDVPGDDDEFIPLPE